MNAGKISKELSKQFKRSSIQKGRIKGFRPNTEGFSVKQLNDGVLVFWHSGLFNDSNKLQTIKAFLLERGHTVVDQDWQLKVVA